MRRPISSGGTRAVHAKQMVEVAVPERVGAARNRQGLRVGLAHDHEASQPEQGDVRSLEHGAVAVRDRAYLRGEGIGDEIEAIAPRGLGSIGGARACPERRMRFLARLDGYTLARPAIESLGAEE